MTDRYRDLVNTGVGSAVSKRLGLPRPVVLRRYEPGQPLLAGPALVRSVGEQGDAAALVRSVLSAEQVPVRTTATDADTERLAAVVLDATAASTVDDLDLVRLAISHPLKRLAPSGRLLVLGPSPQEARGIEAAAVAQALEGLVRSAAKELRAGATANLVQVGPGAVPALESPVRFFLSARSAYVDGQVLQVRAADVPTGTDWARPHAGRVTLVTGAARGIGAAIAGVLARDGAEVVCLDVPGAGETLAATANKVGGTALQLDVTADDAPARLAAHLRERHGGVDLVVHNAGITRDKLLVNMDDARWRSVLDVNLRAHLRLDEALLDGVLRDGGSLVSVSSTSGIAGNRGQTNYAASKAGVVGMVHAAAPELAGRGITVNAVAPGFIETEMTARMPLGTREAGRRINSLSQGGLPVDVAEAIAFLGAPASAGVTGQVLRVCGQSLVGA